MYLVKCQELRFCLWLQEAHILLVIENIDDSYWNKPGRTLYFLVKASGIGIKAAAIDIFRPGGAFFKNCLQQLNEYMYSYDTKW